MHDGDRVAVCHPEFLEDLQYWVETDRRTARRLLEIVHAVLKDPTAQSDLERKSFDRSISLASSSRTASKTARRFPA